MTFVQAKRCQRSAAGTAGMTLSVRQSSSEAHICRSLHLPCKVIMDYQKVGRGGAGNFYSQQDVEGIAKRATKVEVVLFFSNVRPIDGFARTLKPKAMLLSHRLKT